MPQDDTIRWLDYHTCHTHLPNQRFCCTATYRSQNIDASMLTSTEFACIIAPTSLREPKSTGANEASKEGAPPLCAAASPTSLPAVLVAVDEAHGCTGYYHSNEDSRMRKRRSGLPGLMKMTREAIEAPISHDKRFWAKKSININ